MNPYQRFRRHNVSTHLKITHINYKLKLKKIIKIFSKLNSSSSHLGASYNLIVITFDIKVNFNNMILTHLKK